MIIVTINPLDCLINTKGLLQTLGSNLSNLLTFFHHIANVPIWVYMNVKNNVVL